MTPSRSVHRTVTLLGPQENEGEHAARVLQHLGLGPDSPVALVTAGWQEREREDEALRSALGVRCTNLELHARSEEVFIADHALSAAYKARQERLRNMQAFYRTRLDFADDAARHIAVRHVDPGLLLEEWQVSIDGFRQLDADHLARCQRVFEAFESDWHPGKNAAVARERAAIQAILEQSKALVITGGHVGSLLNRLRLFDIVGLSRHLPIVAWSAGAMVLTERIVCFHDYPPYGKDIAQVLDAGFGLAEGVVVLPNPSGSRQRLNLEEHAGIGRFARRMAPALCVAMGHGAELTFDHHGTLVAGHGDLLMTTGEVDTAWRYARRPKRGRA